MTIYHDDYDEEYIEAASLECMCFTNPDYSYHNNEEYAEVR